MLHEPTGYPPLRMGIKADVFRCRGKYGFWALCWLFLFDRSFRPLFTLRLCQAARELPAIFRPLALWPSRILHQITQQLAAVDLPWRTRIAPGLRITHGWGLVITHGAVIGKNVTVFHGVTIGQKDEISGDGRKTTYPIIEDEVWIGPLAVIIGGVTIGRGCRIAPGTIVTKDVAPYTIFAGNPGQAIQTNALPDVIFPAEFDTTESRTTAKIIGDIP